MGMCLIIWDKMFGTYQEELAEEPVRYGLAKNVEQPYHPTDVVLHEWKAIKKDLRKNISFKDKIKYLFMPPGWSHDGSTQTAVEMRRSLEG